jgi:hypothetical protein
MTTSSPETPDTPSTSAPELAVRGAATVFAERALLRGEDVAAAVEVLRAVATRRAHLRRWRIRGRSAPSDDAASAMAARLASAGGRTIGRGARAARPAGWGRGSWPSVGPAPVVLSRCEALDLVADLVGLADRLARDGARLESLAVEAVGGRVLETLLGVGAFEAAWSTRPSS